MSSLVSTVKPILAHNDVIYNFARKTYHGTKNQVKKIKTDHMNNKLKNRIIEDWKEILAQTDTYNVYTQTFTLKDFKFTQYGMKCSVMFPKGLTKEDFKKVADVIEEGIEAIIVPKYGDDKKRFFSINIVAKNIPQIPFKKVETKPYELFLGHGLDAEPIVWDITKNPHVLVSGTTGAGKSKFLMNFVTNLIINTTEKELGIYALQVDKSDTYPFRRCKQVKCFADTLTKSLSALNYINHLLEARNREVRPLLDQGLAENIKEFNKFNKEKNWEFLIVWIDEFPSYMIDNGDNKEVKAIKYQIMQRISRIYQVGRFCGIFMAVGVQRATIDKLPSFCKSMSNCIISMKQMNINSSLSAIDSTKATDLKEREALIKLSNELQYVKTPFLTAQHMVELIEPYRVSEAEQVKREFDFKKWLNYKPDFAEDISMDDITLPKKSKKQDNGSKTGKVKVDKYKEELKKQSDTIVNQKQQLVQSNTRCMDLEKNLSEKDKELNKYKVENEKLRADNNKLQIKINQNQNIIKTKNKLKTIEKEIEVDDN